MPSQTSSTYAFNSYIIIRLWICADGCTELRITDENVYIIGISITIMKGETASKKPTKSLTKQTNSVAGTSKKSSPSKYPNQA